MTIHPSLKTKSGALNQHRNVLTRTERIARLVNEERFDLATNSALGIVKVRSIKMRAVKKKKEVAAEGAAGAAAPTAAAATGAAAPAGGAAAAKKK